MGETNLRRQDGPPAPAHPRPERRHRSWTKRVFILLAVFWVATGAARLWWGVAAERELDRQVRAIRDRGEPLTYAELAPPPVPDEQNAARLYRRAFESPLLSWQDLPDGDEKERLRRLGSMLMCMYYNRDFRREHPEDLDEIVRLAAEPVELARWARRLDGVDWGIDYDGVTIVIPMRWLGDSRALARVLATVAIGEHERGRDAEAVESIRDLLGLARAVDADAEEIGWLVATGIRSRAFEGVEEVAPGLRVDNGESPAGGDPIRELLTELLDEGPQRRGAVRGMRGQRAYLYQLLELARAGKQEEVINAGGSDGEVLLPTAGFMFRPVLAYEQARLLVIAGKCVEAVGQPTYPLAMDIAPERPVWDYEAGWTHRMARAVSHVHHPTCYIYLRRYYSSLAMRRMAAAAIALRLYELDHGRRPDTLEALVPDYLPSVPDDPFVEGGKVMYLPDNDPPVLYCVGENGRDNGGKFRVYSDGELDRETSPDLVFFLDGLPPQGECTWEPPRPR